MMMFFQKSPFRYFRFL